MTFDFFSFSVVFGRSLTVRCRSSSTSVILHPFPFCFCCCCCNSFYFWHNCHNWLAQTPHAIYLLTTCTYFYGSSYYFENMTNMNGIADEKWNWNWNWKKIAIWFLISVDVSSNFSYYLVAHSVTILLIKTHYSWTIQEKVFDSFEW